MQTLLNAFKISKAACNENYLMECIWLVKKSLKAYCQMQTFCKTRNAPDDYVNKTQLLPNVLSIPIIN